MGISTPPVSNNVQPATIPVLLARVRPRTAFPAILQPEISSQLLSAVLAKMDIMTPMQLLACPATTVALLVPMRLSA